MQQQGLVAPQWCKNPAESCFREETGSDIRNYMILSQLLNVPDGYINHMQCNRELTLKLQLLDTVDLVFASMVKLSTGYQFSVYKRLIIGGVQATDHLF